jgi:hypothetical protein
MGGHQGQSGRVRKISLPPGFYPHTVQPVARSYTDYAVPALEEHKGGKITNWILTDLNL